MKQKFLNVTLAIALMSQTISPAFNSVLAIAISDFSETIIHQNSEKSGIDYSTINYEYIDANLELNIHKPSSLILNTLGYNITPYLDFENAYLLKVMDNSEDGTPVHAPSEQKIILEMKQVDYGVYQLVSLPTEALEVGAWYDLMIPDYSHSTMYMVSIKITDQSPNFNYQYIHDTGLVLNSLVPTVFKFDYFNYIEENLNPYGAYLLKIEDYNENHDPINASSEQKIDIHLVEPTVGEIRVGDKGIQGELTPGYYNLMIPNKSNTMMYMVQLEVVEEVRYEFIKSDLYLDLNNPDDFELPLWTFITDWDWYGNELLYEDYRYLDVDAAYFLEVLGQNDNDDPLHVGSEQRIKADLRYDNDYRDIVAIDEVDVNQFDTDKWYDLMIPNRNHSVIYMFSIKTTKFDYCQGPNDANLDCLIRPVNYTFIDHLIEQGVDTNGDKKISKREALNVSSLLLYSYYQGYQPYYNIDEIVYFKNLDSIEIWSGEQLDLTPIKELYKINSLKLKYSQIEDLNFYSMFANIENLTLEDTNLDSFKQFNNFSKLKSLTLINNEVTDLLPLAILQKSGELKLEELYIDEPNLNHADTMGVVHIENHDMMIGNEIFKIYSVPFYYEIIRGEQPKIRVVKNEEISDFFTKIVDPNGETVNWMNNTYSLQNYGIYTYKVYDKENKEYLVNIDYLANIDFEDEHLLNALINKGIDTDGDGGISIEEAMSVRDLTLNSYSNSMITSLKGLNYFKNLKNLGLSYFSNITDFSELGSLKNLTELRLYEVNKMSDKSFLNDLKKLKTLEIGYSGLEVLEDIVQMKSLTNLNLIGNPLTSIKGIKNLINLNRLVLGDNNLSDFSELGELTELKWLYITGTNIEDISFVKNLTNLMYLEVSRGQVKDISAIEELTNLVTLDLSNNRIADILPIAKLLSNADSQLNNIHLWGNQINHAKTKNAIHLIEYDKYLSKLGHEIWITPGSHVVAEVEKGYQIEFKVDNSVIDFEKIVLPNGQIIEGLSATYSVEDYDILEFYMIDSKGVYYPYEIEKVKPIQFKDENFKKALLKISDVDGDGEITIEEAENVQDLNLNSQGIQDISGIEYFTNATYINLANNQIESLLPFAKLYQTIGQSYNIYFNLYGNPINNSATLNAVHLMDYDIYNYGWLEQEIWEVPATDIVSVDNEIISVQITLNNDWPSKLTGVTLPDGTFVSGTTASYQSISYEELTFIIHDENGKQYSYVVEDPSPIQFTDPLFKQHLLNNGVDLDFDGEITREEARQVKYLNLAYTDITNINEIIYFTGLQSFYGYSSSIKEFIPLSILRQSVEHDIHVGIWNHNAIDANTPYAVYLPQYNIYNSSGQVEYEAWALPAIVKITENQVALTVNKESALHFKSIILPTGEEVFDETVFYQLENQSVTTFIVKDKNDNEYPIVIGSDGNIQFTDYHFKNSLLDKVDSNRDGEISYQEALNVQKLRIWGHFNNIDEIKYFKNLTSLSLGRYGDLDAVFDYTPIGELTKLKELDLTNQNVGDASFIKTLTKLSRLYMTNANVSEISWIENLSYLNELYLSDNQINDFSPLSSLQNLKFLQLNNTGFNNLSVLTSMKELGSLYLDGNNLTNVSELKNIPKLYSLSLSNNPNLDVNTIGMYNQLGWLYLSDMNLQDISFISNYTRLESLIMDNNKITDITPLFGLNSIWQLGLNNNKITDLTGINQMSNLQYVYLRDNQITDILPLAKLSVEHRLYEASLNNNPLNNSETLGAIYLSDLFVPDSNQSYPVWVIPQNYITTQVVGQNIQVMFDSYLSVTDVTTDGQSLPINNIVLPPREEAYVLSIGDKYGNRYEFTLEHNALNTAPTIELI